MNDEERHWSTVEPLVDPTLLGTDTTAAAGTFRGEIPARMRLRLNGVRFSNYFTSTAPCSPARGVFYTGHHAPDTQVIVITGYATIETSHEADALGAYQFVAKPFKIKDIVKLVTKSSRAS